MMAKRDRLAAIEKKLNALCRLVIAMAYVETQGGPTSGSGWFLKETLRDLQKALGYILEPPVEKDDGEA